MTDPSLSTTATLRGGRHAVVVEAPAAAATLDRLEAVVWRSVDPDLGELAARLCAATHGLEPLTRPAGLGTDRWLGRDAARWRTFDDLTSAERAALSFAEQYTTDVSAISDDLRRALTDAFGDRALAFAHALYVLDVAPRGRAALDQLFGADAQPHAGSPTAAGDADADAELWAAIQANVRTVPGLDALDPLTSELVRLRVARQHNCRICKSLRSAAAFEAGADETTFDAVDTYDDADLSDTIKAALALTDAVVWTPARIPVEVLDRVRAHFTPAQQVELVLDVVRHSTNKFAVSMGVDTPHVTEGFEVYRVDPDGSTTYGLPRPGAPGASGAPGAAPAGASSEDTPSA